MLNINGLHVFLQALIKTLERENIKYVHNIDEQIQYQINFLTENPILAVGEENRTRILENLLKFQKKI